MKFVNIEILTTVTVANTVFENVTPSSQTFTDVSEERRENST
jgi:hypothetical protein